MQQTMMAQLVQAMQTLWPIQQGGAAHGKYFLSQQPNRLHTVILAQAKTHGTVHFILMKIYQFHVGADADLNFRVGCLKSVQSGNKPFGSK